MTGFRRGWGDVRGKGHYFRDGHSLCDRFLERPKQAICDCMDVEHGGYMHARSDPSFCQECVERWKDLRISEGDRLP